MLKATIIGNLGGDAELKFSQSGQPLLRANLAANYRVRDQFGAWDDKTEWVRVTVFGQRAEALAPILKKGTRIYAEGRLEARPWTDQSGGLRAGLEMVASDIEFMGARPADGDERPAQHREVADSDLPF